MNIKIRDFLTRAPVGVAAFVFLAALLLRPAGSYAQGLSFIRDAEIENTIRAYAAPLFRAAGLDPDAVRIFLVNDRTLNAFVSGGQKLFINTGLLIRTDNASQVIGVIAHETGHIADGHLSRTPGAIEKSTAESLVSFILGAAAAIAGGRPDVGGAIIAGGQSVGLRSFLHYSRTQEAAADQAAMRLLDATGQSSKGMLQFLETLVDQEQLSTERQDPYLQTHPLTLDRIDSIRAHIANDTADIRPEPAKFEEMHRRMRAKLIAFLNPVPLTLRLYKASDKSVAARYARAIAYFRKPDLEKALPLIDGLIAERPDDPYFHELKGQMLFENGRVKEARVAYQRAVELLPRSPLLRTQLAQVQVELNDPAQLDPAILNLRSALQHDPRMPFAWRQLAIAFGRKGNMGESSLALAEEALLLGRVGDARYHAGRAATLMPRGSPGWLKAEDILSTAHATGGKKRK